MICEAFYGADAAWLTAREQVAIGYAEEEREYAELHPRPTLKFMMITLAGSREEHDNTIGTPNE